MGIETEKLPTGTHLDNLLAEKLMGYRNPHEVFIEKAWPNPIPLVVFTDWDGPKDNCMLTNYVRIGSPSGKRLKKPYWMAPRFHSDVAEAMRALHRARMLIREKLRDAGAPALRAIGQDESADLAYFEIKGFDGSSPDEAYYCRIDISFMATGATVAEAVSRAALRVALWAESAKKDNCRAF